MDLDDNQWIELEPMSSRRSGCSSLIHDDCIYVMGGLNDDGINESDISVYSLHLHSWK